MKFLVAGLGNIGDEYAHTRHNIGFDVLDSLAGSSGTSFFTDRYADVAHLKYKGKMFVLIKPSTYMNLSGKAVKYWLDKEKIPLEHLLVITDDLALPFGKLRLRAKGSDGGHNGLKNIAQVLGSEHYARLRFGVAGEFKKGAQVDYVLGKWNDDEAKNLQGRIDKAIEIITSFGTIGIDRSMALFNNQ